MATSHTKEMTNEQVYSALKSWFESRPSRYGYSSAERVRWIMFYLSELEQRGAVPPLEDDETCTCSQYVEHIGGTPCQACKRQARENEVEF